MNKNKTLPLFVLSAALAAANLNCPAQTTSYSEQTVPATAEIAGAGDAGLPDANGTAPVGIVLPANPSVLTMSSVTGTWSLTTGSESNDPDGVGGGGPYPAMSYSGPYGGISGIRMPGVGALVGVFETATGPTSGTPPATLDFTVIGTNFASLSPALNQVFFIGDGLTGDGSGSVQQFMVPLGATRLYLGCADAGNYNGSPGAYSDNSGTFTVSFQVSSTATGTTYTFTNSADTNWFNPANWSPNGVPGLNEDGFGDTAVITNWTVGVPDGASVGTLDLSGGTLIAPYGLTILSGGDWTGGKLNGQVTVGESAEFYLSNPGGTLDLPATSLFILGTVIWEGGTIRGDGGTVITNNGTWLISGGNGEFNNNGYSGTPAFVNNSSFVMQNEAANIVAFSGVAFTNNYHAADAVYVQGGTLLFRGGGYLNGGFYAAAGATIRFDQVSGEDAPFTTGPNFRCTGPGVNELTGGAMTLGYNQAGLELTGGTVTLGPQFQNNGAITNLTLDGADLAGTNTLTGTMNWVSGDLYGVFTIASGGVLNLSGAGEVDQFAALTNSGHIYWNGSGDWCLYNYIPYGYQGQINNLSGGVIDAQCNNEMRYEYGYEWFSNSGLFRKTASTGTTTIDVTFTNTAAGAVAVESGEMDFTFGNGSFGGVFQAANGTALEFKGGGALIGSFTAGFGADIGFDNGTFTEASASFGGAGTVELNGGILTLQNDIIPNLQLNGGTLDLPAGFQGGAITNLTVTGITLTGSNTVTGVLNLNGTVNGPLVVASGGVVNWSGGEIDDGLTIAQGGVLNMAGSDSSLYCTAVTNAGTVNWTGGYLSLLHGTTFENLAGGVFNIECDNNFDYGNGTETINNAGLVQKSGTTGQTTIYPNLINTGVVIVQSGTLTFDDYYYNYYGQTGMLGGTFQAEAGATLEFNAGGNLTGNFSSAAGGNIILYGGTFTPGPNLVFNGPGTNTMTGGTITLTNSTIANLQLTGGTVVLAPTFQGGQITNLDLNGASIAGTNTVTGTLNLSGGVQGSLTVASNATLNLGGGINPNASLTLLPGATLNWSNGACYYPLTIPSNCVMNLAGPGEVELYAPVTNAGTVNWNGGELYINGNGAFYNLAGATFNIQSNNLSGSGGGLFNNAGLVRKWLNPGAVQVKFTFNNYGLVDVQTGTLQISGAIQNSNLGGGTYLAEAAATLNFSGGGYLTDEFTAAGGGTMDFSGGVFTNTTSTVLDGVGAYILNGGTFNNLFYNLPSNLQLVSGSINPGPQFEGGSIANLTLNGLNITGSNTVTGVLSVIGNVAGPLTVAGGATLSVNGNLTAPITLQSGATFNWTGQYPYQNAPVTVAAGAVWNMAPTNEADIYDPVTNSGTINWTGGSLYLDNYQYPYEYGDLIYNLSGATFNILTDQRIIGYGYYGNALITNAGTFRKSGTSGINNIQLSFANTGTIDVESGTLDFASTFSQSGGTWDIGLNGAGNNGVIAFNGSAPLPSVLNVTANNGYIPALNDSFPIARYSSLTGYIAATNLPADGAAWQLNEGSSVLSLVVTNLAEPTVTITSPADGATFTAPNTITLSATVVDTNASIASVQFYQGTSLLGAGKPQNQTTYNLAWNSPAPGAYAISALATDVNGGLAVSAPVHITVFSSGPQAVTYTWTPVASSTDWFTAGNWNPSGVPGPLDNVIINNGLPVVLSHSASVNNVVLSSGAIGGTGALTVTNSFNWTGGTVTNTLTIAAAATLAINSATNVSLTNGTLVNLGTVQWTRGVIFGNPATIISNSPGALWLIQTDNDLVLGNTVAVTNGLFVNNGTVRKITTTGTTYFESGNFINNGVVDAQSGTIAFYSGGTLGGVYNTAAGATIRFLNGAFILGSLPTFTGQGSAYFSGGTLTMLQTVAPQLQLIGGSVTLGPAFQGGSITNLTLSGSTLSGTNTVTGTLNCLSGTVGGGLLTVAANGVLVLGINNYYNDVYLQNLSLVNSGEVLWLGGYVYCYNSAITNNNLWLIQGGYKTYDGTFVNNGLIKQTSAGSSYFENPVFINNGTVDAEAGTISLWGGGSFAGAYNTAAGATISFAGGSNTLNTAAGLPNFTGLGSFQFNGGTLLMNNDIDPALQLTGGTVLLGPAFQNGGAINNLVINGATLGGTNTVTGTLTIMNGTDNGPLTINSNATLNVLPGYLNASGPITNFGSVFCTGSTENFDADSTNAFIVNNGLWLNQGASDFYGNQSAAFINNGIYRQQGSTSGTEFNIPFLNNGLFDLRTGYVYIESGGVLGGTFDLAAQTYVDLYDGNFTTAVPPANFTGAGSVEMDYDATFTLTGDVIPNLPLTGGTVLIGTNFQRNGAITNLTLSGATLGGANYVSGTLILGSGSQVSGSLTVLTNALLILSGTADSSITFDSAAAIINNGVVDWTGGYIYAYPTTVITNFGLWLAETDNEMLNYNYWDYYYGYDSGDEPNVPFNNLGTFAKTTTTGATTFYGMAFLNSGTLDIQSGSADFSANNYDTNSVPYAQTGATLAFGVSAPNLAGRLILSTNISLDGTLEADLLNGYTPNLGDEIPVITYGPASQTAFANLVLPPLTGMTWDVESGASGVNLRVVPSVVTATPLQISGSVTNALGQPIAGVTVYATQTGVSNLIQNGSFELPAIPPNSGAGYQMYSSGATNVTGWTVTTPANEIAIYNTGVNAAGVALTGGAADPHWTLSGTTTTTPVVLSPGSMYYDWTRDSTGSAWIGVLDGSYEPPAPYTFSQTFSLAGINTATAKLSGTWWGDDSVSFYLNGNLIANGNENWYGEPWSVTDPSWFNSGLNTLSFVMNGSDQYFDGVRLEGGNNIYIYDNNYLGAAEDGTQYLNPSGAAGGGGISQSFPTVPGTTYELVFYHGTYQRQYLNTVLGVTIDTNYYTFGETDGSYYGNLDWRRVQILFTASSDLTTLTFSDLTGISADDNFVDNVQVIPPGLGTVAQATTDANGNYQMTVPSGTFQVGVDGLPNAGYNNVQEQSVLVNVDHNPAPANFVSTPLSGGEFFSITTSVNPPALGTASGGGAGFRLGAPAAVSVVQNANANALPYFFSGWTENGVLESTNLNYSFAVFRNRNLVANFALPGLLVTASNNPPADGLVNGAGLCTYNTTNVLTAVPLPGFKFVDWTSNGLIVSAANPLSTLVQTNLFLVANYEDANPIHLVTVSNLLGTNLTATKGTGAGTYTNGQTAVITAPLALTNSGVFYVFQGFTLGGAAVTSAASFTKSFSTFDPPSLNYVADYRALGSLQPQIISAYDNYPNPVPATTGFLLTFQFDRSMSAHPAPLVILTNSAAAVQATAGSNGLWTTTSISNDTYQTPGITFGSGMDGNVRVFVSRAQDIYGHTLSPTNVINLLVHSTPPPPPVVTITNPANNVILSNTTGFVIRGTVTSTNFSGGVVDLYANGAFLGLGVLGSSSTSSNTPYSFSVNPGRLALGSYSLQAVAIDASQLSATSAVVHLTMESPDSTLIDFEGLNAMAGPVGGAGLSNYLALFGVKATNVTTNTSLAAANDQVFLGGGVVTNAPGDGNFLIQTGANGPVSYTLLFAPCASVSWVRDALLAGTTGASLPGWRAHIFDAEGNVLGSAGENSLGSFTNLPAARFTLLGTNIVSIRFDGNNQGLSSLSTLPLDDLLLSTVATNTTLAVGLTTNSALTSLAAPGTVALVASVSDSEGTVSQVNFYEGSNFLSAMPVVSNGPSVTASLTLNNLAAGTYVFTAQASDSLGAVVTSNPLTNTVAASQGVKVMNFDVLNTAGGSVGGTNLSNYLAGFGVVLSNVTVGSALEAVSGGLVTGSGGAVASSPPNYFTQAGLNQPVSFTLVFGAPQQAFGWTRVGLLAGSGGVSHPQWTATAYDGAGVELGSAGEGLMVSAANVPARSFLLTGLSGDGVASVRFDSDSQKTASFSAVLLDDLILNGMNASPMAAPLSAELTGLPTSGTARAPATFTLGATVADTLGADYAVNFYVGPNLAGSAVAGNYVWSGVLAGTYTVRAQVVDSSGVTAYSSPVTVMVTGTAGNAQVVNFDTAPAVANLSSYLAGYGIVLSNNSAGTKVVAENQTNANLRGAVAAASPPNIVTQTGPAGPKSYTVSFATLLTNFGFTRPELLANPFMSQPAWTATAYDAAGVELTNAGEGLIGSYTNVGAQVFNLSGPGIASVQFASQGSGLTTLGAMVADDFVLTTNAGGFPPAVAITNPAAGLQVIAPPALTVAAQALDPAGIASVSFYANGVLIGTAASSPYSVSWVNPGTGGYGLTAVAVDQNGLMRTSPVVAVTVLPPELAFAITSQPQPASQTAKVGSSVSYAVTATGIPPLTYQWYQNGSALPGQTGSTLTLFPLTTGEAGSYTVVVSNTASLSALTSSAAVLTVAQPPEITTQPVGQTVAIGANVTLSVEVDTDDPPFTWQWLLNGTPIAGETNRIYSILAAQPLNSGNYQVLVGNAAAFVASSNAAVVVQSGSSAAQTVNNDNFSNRISINPLLGPVLGNNVNATSEPGEPLHDGKPGGKSIWYTWTASFTGVISLGTQGSDFDTLLAVYTGTNLTKLTPIAADDDSGGFFTSLVTFNVTAGTVYQIAVDGFKGASGNVVLGMPSGTAYRVLTPASGSSVPVITSQPASQLVPAGASVTLKVVAANAQTWQWYFQGAPVGVGGTNSSLTLTNFQAGSVGLYDVLVANAVGSVESQQASLQIAAAANQAGGAGGSSQDKFGSAVDLATNKPVLTLARGPESGGGDTRGFSVSQVFSTVGATKEVGEPDHDGQAGGASQWFVYTAPAKGTLRVSTAGSSYNSILAIYTNTGSSASFASLKAVGGDYVTNFQQQPGRPTVYLSNAVSGTKYFIAVDGYNGASGTVLLNVGLGAGPVINSQPANQYVVLGSNATFNVAATGATNLYYQWQFNGVNIAKATNTLYTVTNTTPANAGSYGVIVSNIVGVVTNAPPATLTLATNPVITVPPANQTVFLGRKAGFAVTVVGVNTKTNPLRYQWFFTSNSVPAARLAGATNSTLAFPAAQYTNNGSYSVTIANSYGGTTSAVVTLTVVDTNRPTVAFTAPANNSTNSTGTTNVTGTAADKYVAVTHVRVAVGTNAFQTATGAATWSAPVTLVPGTNLIYAYSVNQAGTNSLTNTLRLIYQVHSTLTVQTNIAGAGRVTSTSGATNRASLILGQNYTITAAHGSNYLFTNWTSGTSSGPLTNYPGGTNLTFMMYSNMVLQANFVPNPFPALAGSYNGLFYPTNGVTEASSGYITVIVQSNSAGAYSASLRLDGGTYIYSGAFGLNGLAQTNLPRAGTNPVLVTLNLDFNQADAFMGGSVSNEATGWNSVIQADRAVFNTNANPATNYAGHFTLLLPPDAATAPAGSPGGYGWAVITSTLGGNSTLSGLLADGKPFSWSAPISQYGAVPLYQSLYSGKGSLLGWVYFTNEPPKTVQTNSSVSWIKPSVSKTMYPAGFTNLLPGVLGSFYTNTTGELALNLTNATLDLSAGNLSGGTLTFTNIDIGTNSSSHNFLTNLDAGLALGLTNYLAIQINPTNGEVTVTFRATGSKTNTVGTGVVLQNQTNAAGYFPGTNQTGSLILH